MEISGLISFHNRLDMKVNYIDNDSVKYLPLKVKELLVEKVVSGSTIQTIKSDLRE